jgi:hypothetical protein
MPAAGLFADLPSGQTAASASSTRQTALAPGSAIAAGRAMCVLAYSRTGLPDDELNAQAITASITAVHAPGPPPDRKANRP